MRGRGSVVLAVAGLILTGVLVAAAWVLAAIEGDANPLHGAFGPDLVVPIGIAVVGAVVASRRSSNPIGWLLLATGIIDAVRSAAAQYAVFGLSHDLRLPAVPWIAWLSNWDLFLIFPAGTFLFSFLLFPDGRLPSRRWRFLAWAAAAYETVALISTWFDPHPILLTTAAPPAANPLGINGFPLAATTTVTQLLWPVGLVLVLLAAISVVRRYQRSDGEVRQQIKWFAFAVAFTVAAILVTVPTSLRNPSTSGTASPVMDAAIIVGLGLAVPVGCGIAILKYRLYGIDIVISRTLVYGVLAALITGVYVAIAVGVGTLAGSGGKPNIGLSILATAIVAVGFQPVRQRVQHVVNRLVYGPRATPYEALSQFSGRAAETYSLSDVLPTMAKLLAEGTGAERADVWVRSGTLLEPAASWPRDAPRLAPMSMNGYGDQLAIPGALRAVAVNHQGDVLGALSVCKRRSETLTPVERKLLDDLALQAGLVLKNVSLTADLQRQVEELRTSRQRLVTAQDDERRRLERNLHDGAQQHLVALKVKLGLADMLLPDQPEKAKGAVQQLKSDADEALETLRDLARGIYPPLLADKGLVFALESQARKALLPVSVEADHVSRYPQNTEAAVYFCVLEALQNIQKYAEASRVTVRLSECNAGLAFDVTDDGRGFEPTTQPRGAGLTNMADRLDALGGRLTVESSPGSGTRIAGWLPTD